MIFLVLFVPVACVAAYFWKRPRWQSCSYNTSAQTFTPTAWAALWATGAAALLLIAGVFIPTTVVYVQQLNSRASITQYQQNQAVYNKKANDLTARFTTILGVQYPKFEKAIFDKIGPKAKTLSPASVDAYMVAYPQLKTSTVLVKLVDEINTLRSQIYDQQLAIIQTQKEIKVRTQNPCLLTFLLPS